MREFARVTSASVGARYPAIGELKLHHIVDVLKNDLVAVEEYDTLYTTNTQCVISIGVPALHGAFIYCSVLNQRIVKSSKTEL